MTVVFPDIEPLLVEYISDRLTIIDTELTSDVRVATIKAPADLGPFSKEIVVTASYNTTLDKVRREANAVLEIYADDYATASGLAALIAGVIVDIPHDPIKRAEISLGPVRITEESPQEKRSLTVDFVVKGSDL
jgi:hypothetical protein